MIRWFIDLLYASTPIEFESLFDVDQSVRRLTDATGRTVFAAVFQQLAVGKVSASRVSLQRIIPFVANSFKPYFIGEFRVSDHRVILSGRFTMHWSSKLFMGFWFGGCIFWTLLVAVGVLKNGDANYWWAPFLGVGMICAGFLLVYVGKWFARNDVAWLSRVIRESLGGPLKDRAETDRQPARLGSRAASTHPSR